MAQVYILVMHCPGYLIITLGGGTQRKSKDLISKSVKLAQSNPTLQLPKYKLRLPKIQ